MTRVIVYSASLVAFAAGKPFLPQNPLHGLTTSSDRDDAGLDLHPQLDLVGRRRLDGPLRENDRPAPKLHIREQPVPALPTVRGLPWPRPVLLLDVAVGRVLDEFCRGAGAGDHRDVPGRCVGW